MFGNGYHSHSAQLEHLESFFFPALGELAWAPRPQASTRWLLPLQRAAMPLHLPPWFLEVEARRAIRPLQWVKVATITHFLPSNSAEKRGPEVSLLFQGRTPGEVTVLRRTSFPQRQAFGKYYVLTHSQQSLTKPLPAVGTDHFWYKEVHR